MEHFTTQRLWMPAAWYEGNSFLIRGREYGWVISKNLTPGTHLILDTNGYFAP